jgi:predicted RNA-binding Zn-ribbon protein involved in translation (DUF1610 family)
VWPTTDARVGAVAEADEMHVRFVCEDCGVKWFAPLMRALDAAPAECAACGGRLVPLDHDHENPSGFSGSAQVPGP